MTVRSVVFDYGMVLSGPPDPLAKAELRRISGLSEEELERWYWIDRHAYDRGDLTGLQFWQKLVADAGLALIPAEIAALNEWDARMWTTQNHEMLVWRKRLQALGIQTGILSNMGDSVHESLKAHFKWIDEIDVPIWSYEHRMAKPEAAIYQLLLERTGTPAAATLFLDDKLENIQAAQRMGIVGLQFSTVEQLRQDLISTGLDASLPLP